MQQPPEHWSERLRAQSEAHDGPLPGEGEEIEIFHSQPPAVREPEPDPNHVEPPFDEPSIFPGETMSAIAKTETPATPPDATALQHVLIQGDLSKITPDQRMAYYNAVCSSLGLNPLTQPFAYLTLN